MPRNFRRNKSTSKGRSSSREESSGSPNSSRQRSGGFRKRTEGGNESPQFRSDTGGPFRKRDSGPGRDRRGEGDDRNSGNRNFKSPGRFRGKPDGERSGTFRDKKPFGKRDEGTSIRRPGGFSKSSGSGGFGLNRGERDSTDRAKRFSKPSGPGRNFANSGNKKSYSKSNEGPTDDRKRFPSSTGSGRFGDMDEKGSVKRKEGYSSFERPKRFSKSSYGDRKNQRPFSATVPDDPRRGRNFSPEGRDKKPLRKHGQKSFVQSRIEKQRDQSDTRSVKETDEKRGTELIRLNKFISNSGVCSRREADELIKMGLITVNGTTITEMGFKVTLTDEVRHEGKKLTAEKPVYILMNKPKGFITTTDDPQERNTVMQIIAGACKERVYPVGRLDRNTTGLLMLTNDGDLADKLTHPSYNVKKIYKVELDRPLTKADHQRITEGVQLEEGRAMVDDFAIVSDDNKTVGIELHIGWNHVVRRIFESLDYQVVKLDRVVYAGLDKQNLPRGKWRFLKQEEIIRLKHYK